MKRCPECRRDYYDETLLYCLDDGSVLLDGPGQPSKTPESADGRFTDAPQTAILADPPALEGGEVAREHPTRPLIRNEGSQVEPQDSSGNDPELSFSAGRRAKPLAAIISATLLLIGGFLGYRYLIASGPGQINSIAVMPFLNESGDSDVDYLSDGMTETLIRSLTQLPGLSVKSRSSVFRYKGKDTDLRTVGTELGVQAVLTGRIVQRGDQLRLSLELINADSDTVIWTDTYDRKLTDLVGLQNDIARDVSTKLRLKLTNADEQKLAKNYTADPEVYRLYLQGRFYWNKRTPAEVAKAIPFFKQAIDRDPNFALGYVGLADSDEDNDRPQKKEYVRRALEIDADLAEARASLGYQYMLDYDWAASERELKRAMELNPKYPQSYAWNGARLMMIGRYDEAIASIDQALLIEPASNGFNFYKGVCLGVAGRYDESIEQFKRTIALDPTFPWPHSHLARIYRLKGDLPAAAEERAISLDLDGSPEVAKGIRESFAKGGWEAAQDYIRTQDPRRFGILQTRYEKDGWIHRLQEQAANGSFWLFMIKTDPIFDPLRGDPRFEALVRKFDAPKL